MMKKTLMDILEKVKTLNSFPIFIITPRFFFKDEQVLGTISWNPKNDLKSTYKLRIEKVYLCSTINGHIPIYDPDGTYYKKGPQFGCSGSNKLLSDRFLLLDRNNTDDLVPQNLFEFNAKFINDKNSKIGIRDSFTFDAKPLFDNKLNQQNINKNWYMQVFFYIGPASTMDTFKSHHKRDNTKYYSSFYNFSSIYNNGTNIQRIKLTYKERSNRINKLNVNENSFAHRHQLKGSKKENLLKFIIPIIIIILLAFIAFIGVLFFKKYKNIKSFKSPPFPVNTSSSNSTESSMIVVAAKTEYVQKDGSVQTKLLKPDPFGDDSNCTLQTVISSSTSSTNSNSNMLSNENCYSANNKAENMGLYSSEKLKMFFKKIYTPVPTECDEISNYTLNRYKNATATNKSGSNYLYFNYNNTDLNVNNEGTKISSTKCLITNNPKRLSGTEV